MQATPFFNILNEFMRVFGESQAVEMLKIMINMRAKKRKKAEMLFLLVDFVAKTKGIENQILTQVQHADKVYYLYRAMIFYAAVNTLKMSYRQVAKVFNITHVAVFKHCTKFDTFLLKQDSDKEIASTYIAVEEFCKKITKEESSEN